MGRFSCLTEDKIKGLRESVTEGLKTPHSFSVDLILLPKYKVKCARLGLDLSGPVNEFMRKFVDEPEPERPAELQEAVVPLEAVPAESEDARRQRYFKDLERDWPALTLDQRGRHETFIVRTYGEATAGSLLAKFGALSMGGGSFTPVGGTFLPPS